MKKILIVLVIVMLCLGIVACGSSSAAEEEVTYSVGDPLEYEGVTYTLLSIDTSAGDDWDEPAAGNEFVIVTVKIENNSGEKISYNSLDWQMLNTDGQYADEAWVIFDSDTNLGSGELADSGTKEGTIVFEEPKDATGLKLCYYENILLDDESSFEISLD
jgi:hypothetical protein